MALPDETALRLLAKHKIEIAALPRAVPANAFAGKGCGLPCSLCEQLIDAHEYELEYAGADGETRRFHIRCQQIWQCVLSEWCSVNR
jgi:hypothetical protein